MNFKKYILLYLVWINVDWEVIIMWLEKKIFIIYYVFVNV